MANLNKVFLIGRLTRDPEVLYTQQGTPLAKLGMAVNRVWRDQNGEQREETCFVDLEAWGKRAQTIEKYLRKGSPIFVEGHLRFNSWETREGEKRSKLNVNIDNFQFLDSQSSRKGFDPGVSAQPQQATRPAAPQPESSDTGTYAPQANESWGAYPTQPVDDDLGLPGGGKDSDVPF